jgi:hypothetical protein
MEAELLNQSTLTTAYIRSCVYPYTSLQVLTVWWYLLWLPRTIYKLCLVRDYSFICDVLGLFICIYAI